MNITRQREGGRCSGHLARFKKSIVDKVSCETDGIDRQNNMLSSDFCDIMQLSRFYMLNLENYFIKQNFHSSNP